MCNWRYVTPISGVISPYWNNWFWGPPCKSVKLTVRTCKLMVGSDEFSFQDGLFSGSFAVSFGEGTGLSCWYLGSMDYFTPITVGWIRPGYVGEIAQLTNDRYEMNPSPLFCEVNPFTVSPRRVSLASAMNGMMTWVVPNRTRAMRQAAA